MTQHNKVPAEEESTRTVIKEAMSQLKNDKDYHPTPCPADMCQYRSDPDSFDRKFEVCYNARILKVIMGMGSVLLVIAGGALAAWISLQSDIAVIKERQNGYQQVLTELKEIRSEITDLKIKIAQSNNKGNP